MYFRDVENIQISKCLLQEMWENAYAINRCCWLKVTSNSMFPLIEAGDKLFVEFVSPSRLVPGDIITYRCREDILITHRVVGRVFKEDGELHFFEKGDRGVFAPLIPQKVILGKVTKIRKNESVFELNDGIIGFFNKMLAFYSIFIFRLNETLFSRRMNSLNRKRRLYISKFLLRLSLLPNMMFIMLKKLYGVFLSG